MAISTFSVGTLECPVEECGEQLTVDSEPEIDWKHGVTNINLKLPVETLEHLQDHINDAIASRHDGPSPEDPATAAEQQAEKPADASDYAGEADEQGPEAEGADEQSAEGKADEQVPDPNPEPSAGSEAEPVKKKTASKKK